MISGPLSYRDFWEMGPRPQSAFRPGLTGLEGLLNGLVQEGRKWLFQVKFFFLQKCLNFCICFLIKQKNILLHRYSGWNALVLFCCGHCARLNILSLFFSETKCKPGKRNTGECCTTWLKSTCKNSGTFEGEKISPEKVPLAPSHSIFIIGNSNFEIVYFKRYNFILCRKIICFMGTLKSIKMSKNAFLQKVPGVNGLKINLKGQLELKNFV